MTFNWQKRFLACVVLAWTMSPAMPAAMAQFVSTGGPMKGGGRLKAIATNGKVVLAGIISTNLTSGHLFRSINNGQSWLEVNGLNSEPVQSLACGSSACFAGTNKGVYRSLNEGQTWKLMHSTSGTVMALVAFHLQVLAGTNDGKIFASQNNGSTWTATNFKGGFVTEVVFGGGPRLYASTYDGAWKSADGGNTWTAINNGLTDKMVPAFSATGKLFAGTGSAGVFVSINDGALWVPSNKGATLKGVRVLRLVYNRMFAGGYKSGVFVSTDNGDSWMPVNGLGSLAVWSIGGDDAGVNVFAGTDEGLVYRWQGGGKGTATNKSEPVVDANTPTAPSTETLRPLNQADLNKTLFNAGCRAGKAGEYVCYSLSAYRWCEGLRKQGQVRACRRQ